MNDYIRPANLSDAIACLAERPHLLLAGGTDLYPAITAQRLDGRILDLTAVGGMRGLTVTPQGGIRIGACTSWWDIMRADPAAGVAPRAARHPTGNAIQEPASDEGPAVAPDAAQLAPLAALREAAGQVGGRQIQTSGTIGGNLCNASPAADGVPPLLVLDAEVELAGPRGNRRIALAQFLTGPRRTLRAPDEILVAVHLPASALTGRSAFRKLGARRHLVISIVMVAARLQVADGRIVAAALAVGACSGVAQRLAAVERAMIGVAVEDAAASIDGAAVAQALAPLDDHRGSAGYRLDAATELLRRLVAELGHAPPVGAGPVGAGQAGAASSRGAATTGMGTTGMAATGMEGST